LSAGRTDLLTPHKHASTNPQAILHGSKEAKEEGLVSGDAKPSTSDLAAQQHSKLIGRGKYVHEIVTHNIIPSHRDAYLEAAEAYYRALLERGAEFGGIKTTGAWECVVGSVGEFTHIFEYEGYRGFDEFMRKFKGDEVSGAAGTGLRIRRVGGRTAEQRL
jgi:hypothetical protein